MVSGCDLYIATAIWHWRTLYEKASGANIAKHKSTSVLHHFANRGTSKFSNTPVNATRSKVSPEVKSPYNAGARANHGPNNDKYHHINKASCPTVLGLSQDPKQHPMHPSRTNKMKMILTSWKSQLLNFRYQCYLKWLLVCMPNIL